MMKKMLACAVVVLPSLVLADAHNEKKDAAKKTDAVAKQAAPAAPASMTNPTPPPEVAAMMKSAAGTWKCTGKGAMDPSKPTEMTEFKGTYKAALDLDKFWIRGQWTGAAGKLKMKGIVYTTFDPASKKWQRVMVDNWGMSGRETSAGLPAGATEGKITWEGESWMMGQTMKGRTTEEIAKRSMTMTVEMSPDGKKWMTGMQMTCTK